jgi:hypothetical protein
VQLEAGEEYWLVKSVSMQEIQLWINFDSEGYIGELQVAGIIAKY